MPNWPLETWALVAAIAGITVFCILHVLASVVRDHYRQEKLNAEVERLRAVYAQRLQELRQRQADGAGIDTEPIEGKFDAVPEKRAA